MAERCNKYQLYWKMLQTKVTQNKFPENNSGNAYLCLPQEWSKGTPKICVFEILYHNALICKVYFTVERCKKYPLDRKMLHTIRRIKFPKRKLSRWISLSTLGMELESFKNLRFGNIIIYWLWESSF